VRIKARNPQKRKYAEALEDETIYILNVMKETITRDTSEEDIEILYKSVLMIIYDNKETVHNPTFALFYEELEERIRKYAHLKNDTMKILARFLKFHLELKKVYNIDPEDTGHGSIMLKLTFISERGYDLYMQDLERGEIGKQILSLLLYPPFLANFNLEVKDLVIYLDETEITGTISK
jgi:hypothetical protein